MAPRSLTKVSKTSKSTNSKKEKATKVQKPTKARKVKTPPPVYKAVHGGKATISPILKFPRGSEKAKAFEMVITLVEHSEGAGRYDDERQKFSNTAVERCKRLGISVEDVLAELHYRRDPYRGGSSSVLIRRTDGNKKIQVPNQTFLVDLCDATESMYDCHAYTHHDQGRLRVIFYGISHNTVRAQNAFVHAYNDIMRASQNFKGLGPRNSYRLGNADTLRAKGVARTLSIEAEIKRAEQEAADEFEFDAEQDYENYVPDFDFDDPDFSGAVAEGCIKAEEQHEDEEGNTQLDDKSSWIARMEQVAIYRAKVDETAAAYLEKEGVVLGRNLSKKKKIVNCLGSFNVGKSHGWDLDIGGEKRLCDELNKMEVTTAPQLLLC